MNDEQAIAALQKAIVPLADGEARWDPILELVGDAHFVLLGEASHGTHEFYRARAEMTMRLIAEKGFNAVAVDADWPHACRVNRYVRWLTEEDQDPASALGDFARFPTWMWRNTDVVDFISWLRAHNFALSGDQRCGFYGIDLYSLFSSMQHAVAYLEKVDPDAAKRARYRYSCFDHFGEDSQAYGYAATIGMSATCEKGVVAQLVDIQRRASDYASRDGHIPPDEVFFAQQNARLVANAEEYYRSMFAGRVSSWNLRDRHMAETIDALAAHLRARGLEPKIVVWAHNAHLGDARATEMGREGELNVGQLVRGHHGDDARLIGFTTYDGSVSAASEWDGPAERKRVNPALEGSWEWLFHHAGPSDFILPIRGSEAAQLLEGERLQRAIGVIYLPRTERVSHYFYANLTQQFDAIVHFDRTTALHPLERWARDHTAEVPETFPSGV